MATTARQRIDVSVPSSSSSSSPSVASDCRPSFSSRSKGDGLRIVCKDGHWLELARVPENDYFQACMRHDLFREAQERCIHKPHWEVKVAQKVISTCTSMASTIHYNNNKNAALGINSRYHVVIQSSEQKIKFEPPKKTPKVRIKGMDELLKVLAAADEILMHGWCQTIVAALSGGMVQPQPPSWGVTSSSSSSNSTLRHSSHHLTTDERNHHSVRYNTYSPSYPTTPFYVSFKEPIKIHLYLVRSPSRLKRRATFLEQLGWLEENTLHPETFYPSQNNVKQEEHIKSLSPENRNQKCEITSSSWSSLLPPWVSLPLSIQVGTRLSLNVKRKSYRGFTSSTCTMDRQLRLVYQVSLRWFQGHCFLGQTNDRVSHLPLLFVLPKFWTDLACVAFPLLWLMWYMDRHNIDDHDDFVRRSLYRHYVPTALQIGLVFILSLAWVCVFLLWREIQLLRKRLPIPVI